MASKSEVTEFIHDLILNSDYDIDQIYELTVDKFSDQVLVLQIGVWYQLAVDSVPELK
jgi:hypothetical protein